MSAWFLRLKRALRRSSSHSERYGYGRDPARTLRAFCEGCLVM
jgi:hypothetical protein